MLCFCKHTQGHKAKAAFRDLHACISVITAYTLHEAIHYYGQLYTAALSPGVAIHPQFTLYSLMYLCAKGLTRIKAASSGICS